MTTTIITGASEGIGRGLAEALARRGENVVLAARSADRLAAVAAACEALGGKALAVPTDVTEPGQCEALVARTIERFGRLDRVVHNAGVTMWARFDEITDLSLFERLMKVNYLGAVYLTHHALPHLRHSRGLLVAVSSLTGKTGVPTRTGYAASKHAMQGFFDSLRVELRGSGVDVQVVSPGFVATDIRAHALGPDGRPRLASPRDEDTATMSLDACVRIMVDAIDRREREVVMTAQGKAGLWLKLLAPGLLDRLADRALREKKR
ncbi:MAG: SDR family oxidoreductase [Myxococcales bacterium]|nr:MAG: SDR family oxidoreductase [Myxococcales bacterium]